jgi:hypothetical protein
MVKPKAKSKATGNSKTSKNVGSAVQVAATRRATRSQPTPADEQVTTPPEDAQSTVLPASQAKKNEKSTSTNPAGSEQKSEKPKEGKAKKASGQTPQPPERDESTPTNLTPATTTPRGKKRKAGEGTVAPSSTKRILLKVLGSRTAQAESQRVPVQLRSTLDSVEAVKTAPRTGAAGVASAEPPAKADAPVRDFTEYETEIKVWLAERIDAEILRKAIEECDVPLRTELEKVHSCAVMLAAERYIKVLKDEHYLSEEMVRVEQRNEGASLLMHFALTAHRDEIKAFQRRLDKLTTGIEGAFNYPDW